MNSLWADAVDNLIDRLRARALGMDDNSSLLDAASALGVLTAERDALQMELEELNEVAAAHVSTLTAERDAALAARAAAEAREKDNVAFEGECAAKLGAVEQERDESRNSMRHYLKERDAALALLRAWMEFYGAEEMDTETVIRANAALAAQGDADA